MTKTIRQLLCLCLMTVSINTFAQDKPVYAMTSYIKVDRGQSNTYLDLVKNYGTKIFAERIKSGEIITWALFSVATSSEPTDYNFVAVTTSNSLESLMNLKSAKEISSKAMPNTPDILFDEMAKKYAEIRVNVHSIISKLVDRIPSNTDAKYYNIAYMKVAPAKVNDYLKLETETYKPIHKERQNAGEINGWALWDDTVLTYGENAPYNFVTANSFSDYDKFVNSNYTAAFKKVFPTGDVAKISAQTTATRSMVKSEIWKTEVRLK